MLFCLQCLPSTDVNFGLKKKPGSFEINKEIKYESKEKGGLYNDDS